jgi:hypothetical protein
VKNKKYNARRGFSMLDLLLVIAAIGGVSFVLLPKIFHPRGCRAAPISCTNNLKQVGLAFRIWAGDHNDRMPMQVSVTNGGAMELTEAGSVYAAFLVMSNELNTPKILFCPTDKKRIRAVTFDQPTSAKDRRGSVSALSNTNLTYFVGLDANDTSPSMLLSGDDNFLIGGVRGKLASGSPVPPGILSLRTNAHIAWSNARHEQQGNIGLADGSVQGFSSSSLRLALENTGAETNRLAMP